MAGRTEFLSERTTPTMRALTQATPDLLSGMLATLCIRSTVWCFSELGAPWGFAVLPREGASFHLVTRGHATLDVPGLVDDAPLDEGHLVVLPHGHGHALRDDPASPVVLLEDLLAASPPVHGRLRVDGAGPRTDVLCGGFTLEGRTANPVLAALPPVLHVSTADVRMRETVALLTAELDESRPGAEAVIERLTDLLITQAVRSQLANGDVRGFDDPLIARAIRLLQEQPGHRWTVDELGRRVALSRSTLSQRFRAATGESPMRYLAMLRLTRAAEDLTRTGDSLYEIARRYGYESESSLSRAFRRALGVAPGRYRRRNGDV